MVGGGGRTLCMEYCCKGGRPQRFGNEEGAETTVRVSRVEEG